MSNVVMVSLGIARSGSARTWTRSASLPTCFMNGLQ